VSGRDLLLLLGGLFLLGKSTLAIHRKLEARKAHRSAPLATSFSGVIVQILLLDIVFSFDSVITAAGMVDQLTIMIAAVVLVTGVMIAFAAAISSLVERHPPSRCWLWAFYSWLE
jgi:predicted tellurium resistance membrane protein TerC